MRTGSCIKSLFFYLCSHTFSDHKDHFYQNLSNFYSPKIKILRFWETEFVCISPKTALLLGKRSLFRRIIRRKASDYQSTFPITGSVLCFYLLRLKMVEIMIFWQRLRDSHRYFFLLFTRSLVAKLSVTASSRILPKIYFCQLTTENFFFEAFLMRF